MHIGIFDSGVGGEAIAAAVRARFPKAIVTTVNDHAHMPYGNKTTEEIRHLTQAALQPLLELQCDVIVIACNTATAAALDYLRIAYPAQQFIGLEPMVKPASLLSKTRRVTVCATPSTLQSKSYALLKQLYGTDLKFHEPDCSKWATLIESNTMNQKELLRVAQEAEAFGSDVVVLGCTHYHWIQELLQELLPPGVVILEPSEAVARRIATIAP